MNIWKGGALIKCINVLVSTSKENRKYKGKLFIFNNFIVFTEFLQDKNKHVYQGYSKNENVTFLTMQVNDKNVDIIRVTLGVNFEIIFSQLEENKYDWVNILRQSTIRRQNGNRYYENYNFVCSRIKTEKQS